MEETIEGLGGLELKSREFQLSGVVFVQGSNHKRTLFLLSDYILSCQKNRVFIYFYLFLFIFIYFYFFIFKLVIFIFIYLFLFIFS